MTAIAHVEALYAGDLGDAYTQRHERVPQERRGLWNRILGYGFPNAAGIRPIETILEVGCNVGGNLLGFAVVGRDLAKMTGVDVNVGALSRLDPRIKGVRGSAAKIPLPNDYADLVFTCGMLIHVPSGDLDKVFDELVRVSARYVLTVEYEDAYERMIPWRGHDGILWSRPHSYLLWQRHPELIPVDRGVVGKRDGFDRGMGWALFEKPVMVPAGVSG